MDEGFADWTRKDFRSFTSALEQYGRKDSENVFRQVSHETGKPEHDVEAYFEAFEKNAETNLVEWAKIVEKIEKGEKKIQRQAEIKNALNLKVARHAPNPFQTLTVTYAGVGGGGGVRGKIWSEEEDAYLVCMMHRHGYGQWERIRQEIRRAWQFKFDWFIKSRNAAELQRRGDVLLRCIEKENEDFERKLCEKSKEVSAEKGATWGAVGTVAKSGVKDVRTFPFTKKAKVSSS